MARKATKTVTPIGNNTFLNRFDDLSVMGRPKKFANLTVKQLKERVDAYFVSCYEIQTVVKDTPVEIVERVWKSGEKMGETYESVKTKKEIVEEKVLTKVPTVSGLAVYLGTTRATLLDIEERGLKKESTKKEKDFLNTIRTAKDMILSYAEQQLYIGKNVNGVTFSLKNNRKDWEDKSKQEVDMGEDTINAMLNTLSDKKDTLNDS